MNRFFLLLLLVAIGCSNAASPTPSPTLTSEPPTLSATIVFPTPAPTLTAAPANGTTPDIIVGSMEYTEQRLLGALMVQLLRANGLEVQDRTGLGGSQAVREALQEGVISLYPELTGTALSQYQKIPAENLPKSAERTYQLAKSLDTQNGLVWLQPSAFSSSHALLVREALLQQGVTTIDALARLIDSSETEITLCAEAEFFGRGQDGLTGLLAAYELNFSDDDIVLLSQDEAYSRLRTGECDVSAGLNTDGRITAWNLAVLADTEQFFPFYQAAPVISADLIATYPEIEPILKPLFASLDETTMRNLNARVDIGGDGEFGSGDEKSISDVATGYLELVGLLGLPPLVRIGALDSAEGQLLANLTAQTLEHNDFRTTTQLYSSSQLVRQALTSGTIDLAWENTARSLTAFHSVPLDTIPNDDGATFELIASLDAQFNDLSWLTPTDYSNKLVAVLQPTAAAAIGRTDNMATFLANSEGIPFTLCVDVETYGLVLPLGEAAYGIKFTEDQVQVLNEDVLLEGVRDGTCTMAITRNADSRIAAYDLARLPDPTNILPASNAAPVVTQAVLAQHPQIADLLAAVIPYIDLDTITFAQANVEFGADSVRDSGDEEPLADVVAVMLTETPLFNDLPLIRIAVEPFTEPLLMAQLTQELLVDQGFGVEISADIGDTQDLYEKIERNLADLAWAYTGAALTERHAVQPVPPDPKTAFQTLQTLDADSGLQWLDPTQFNDTYTLIYDPAKIGINLQSFRDLANYMNVNGSPLSLCAENDFLVGLEAIEAAYGFTFDRDLVSEISFEELQTWMRADECDLSQAYRTDGRVAARGYVALADPLGTLPTFTMAALTSPALMTDYPQIEGAINRLTPLLSDSVMADLNAQVAVGADGELFSGDETAVDRVARAFLCQQGLIRRNCDQTDIATSEPDDLMATTLPESPLLADGCTMVEMNGGFEEQAIWSRPITRSSGQYSTVQTRTGKWAMQLGATTDQEGILESYSIAQQIVQFPSEAISAEITFHYYPISRDVFGGDYAGLYLFDAGLTETKEIFDLPLDTAQRWTRANFDLSAYLGDSVMLHFLVVNDGDGIPSTAFIDDVRLQICYGTE